MKSPTATEMVPSGTGARGEVGVEVSSGDKHPKTTSSTYLVGVATPRRSCTMAVTLLTTFSA